MDNYKTDREGQVCTGQTSGLESTAADITHVANPAATALANTETATVATPESEAASVATTLTTASVASPKASTQCISGSTKAAAAPTVPAAATHIHATADTKMDTINISGDH